MLNQQDSRVGWLSVQFAKEPLRSRLMLGLGKRPDSTIGYKSVSTARPKEKAGFRDICNFTPPNSEIET